MSITRARDRSQTTQQGGLTGRHVLFAFLAFFGVIFAVNGYFLYSAITTYTGIVSDEPYRKGLAYNDRIRADERQQALGWQHAITIEPSGNVRMSMLDRTGSPVTGLEFSVTVGRPATSAMDRKLVLSETQSGIYKGTVAPLDSGHWIVSAEALQGAAGAEGGRTVVYRVRERIWLTP
ncbi:MAG: FixH family protein [Hyphomicrobiaceae bacterium]